MEMIVVGLSQSHIDAVLKLISMLKGSFYVLYVLHTPRTDAEPGRYQSQELTYDAVSSLLTRFKEFFENDARHDIWIHSPITNTTIVYDRHNLIYIYGFTDEQINFIDRKGLKREHVSIPYPHVHSYTSAHDNFESKIVNEYQWTRMPLQNEDSQ